MNKISNALRTIAARLNSQPWESETGNAFEMLADELDDIDRQEVPQYEPYREAALHDIHGKWSKRRLGMVLDTDPPSYVGLHSQLEQDFVDAAGELRIPIPEPGTVAAKLLAANILLQKERDILREENRRLVSAMRGE